MTPVIVEQIIKYGRRPLLHIIVMYATNKAVRAYAFGVSETFMASGIDVHVQTTLRSDGLGGNVETRHMSELIATSHADFVVMVGDRNMKHNTVHRERKETLAEVRVADMQGHIWKNWPQNPLKNYERIRDIAHADLDPFVLQYTNKKLDSHRAEAFKCVSLSLRFLLLLFLSSLE